LSLTIESWKEQAMPQISEPELVKRVSPLDPEMNLHYMAGYTNDTVIHNAMLDEAPPSILVVDDEEVCTTFLQDYFQIMGYPFKGASSATEALEILSQYKIDLVVSDIKMKGKDGIELMQEAHKKYPDISFIIMTGYAPDYSYEDIINAGATDFLAKPFSLGELKAKISRIRKEKKILVQFRHTLKRVKNLFGTTVGALAATLEKRDPYTAGHQQRVGHLACTIAQKIGLPVERIEGLRLGAFVHDIGKIGVSSDMLSKPGKLNEAEMDLIRVHSQIGYDILKNIDFPWPIAEMVLQHHERLNGSGYPHGLVGQEILLEAKIIGVADVMEAMSAHRPYRPALGLSMALEEIYQKKGVLYDEGIVEACIRLFVENDFKFEA
jgi:putative two-component system response regulator